MVVVGAVVVVGAMVVVVEVVLVVDVGWVVEVGIEGRDVVVDEVVVGVAPPPVMSPPTEVELFGAGVPWTTELNGLPTANSITVTVPSAMAKTSAMTAIRGQRTPLDAAGPTPMMVGTGIAGGEVGPA